MTLLLYLFYAFYVQCQQIYSLEENIICLIKPCSDEVAQYTYGTETFGDMSNINFALTFLIKFYGSSSSFVASLNDGTNDASILNLVSSQQRFEVIKGSNIYQSQDFNMDCWYQILITQTKMHVCNHIQCFNGDHNHVMSTISNFYLINQATTDYNKIQACCIIMYKGIIYPNQNSLQFYNTKYPEAMIDINIQEKIQSNITSDYSDYKFIAKLGDLFEFDQYDPYLYYDGLLFNGSQFIQINQITLNNQSTFEFRFQKSNIFTSNVILLNYTFPPNRQIYIFLNGSLVTYQFNDQFKQFQLQELPYIHFCLGIIQYYDQQLELLYFLQFSNSEKIQQQSQTILARWTVDNGFGYLQLGSIQNQFNLGEYFNLFHFRQYQGFFYDDQQVMKANCQIYLNDRCIICQNGYILTNTHNCALSCNSVLYTTYLVSSHNQCLRQCYPKCATCDLNNPSICLTCYGIRSNPPNCSCPSKYFEDNVSPNCRKYYPDVTVQTGLLTVECNSGTAGYVFTQNVYFGYHYSTIPIVLFSLNGAGIIYNDAFILNHYITFKNGDYFTINFYCYLYHIYVVNWISSIGFNMPYQFGAGHYPTQSNTHIVNFQTLQLYGETLTPILYVNGWRYLSVGSEYNIRQSAIDSNNIEFYPAPNIFTNFYWISIFTQFKTYSILNTTLDSVLDDQPKSIQGFVVQRGFSIQNHDKFIYLPHKRNSNYFSIKSKYQTPMQIFDWLLIMVSQRCRNDSPCDFYQSYDFYCNLQFPFCQYVQPRQNQFKNSSYYYEYCHVSCKTCIGNSINQCTSCYSEQNMSLITNKCIYNCDLNCLTCSDILNTTCLSCVLFATLTNNQCVCDDGYYFDRDICSKCSHECFTCQSYDYCKTCQIPLVKNGNTCDCGIGKYYDENNQCFACQKKCTTCISDSLCTSCVDPLQILGIGNCQCPESYYYDNNFLCKRCQQYCSACQDINSCNQCQSGMILINNQCICESYKYVDSNQICQDCSIKCKTCNGQLESQCLSCFDDRYIDSDSTKCMCLPGYFDILSQQACQLCPTRCLECSDTEICTKCRINQILINGNCVCQDGYYQSNNRCLSCNTMEGKYILECNYQNCADKIWTSSENCDDGNDIKNDGCTNCKIDKNFKCLNRLNQKSICFKCQDQCKDCQFNNNNNQIICKLCKDGYYLNENICLKCSDNCQTCRSFDQCITCPIINTYPNQQFKCQECDYGQYPSVFDQITQCLPQCGEGIKSELEQCDDGNTYSVDGCNNLCQIEDSFVCFIYQKLSICFINKKPELFIGDTIKISDQQQIIQIKSNQLLKYKSINTQVHLFTQNNYNYTHDVEYSLNTKFDYLVINITINFTVSFKQEIFRIQVGGNIYNIYNQTVSSTTFYKYFENVYILTDVQKQTSELGSQLGSILFYTTLSLTLLQIIVSGISSISLMVKTSNYIYYMKYMNIDFPPNLRMLLAQFDDFNLLRYVNIPQAIFEKFDINFLQNQFNKNAGEGYNNQEINCDFIANIFPFVIQIAQAIILITFINFVMKQIHQRIMRQISNIFDYQSKLMKILRYTQFYLLKSIEKFRQGGILELFLISQYQIYFSIFISLKTFQYNQLYDQIILIINLGFSILLINFMSQQIKNQSTISIISLVNQLLYIFCIVYLNNFQLIQLLFITTQQVVQLYFMISEQQFGISQIIEESSLLLLFLTSILYMYSPIDIDYIHIGFIQFGGILITFMVNMIMQICELYGQIVKYFNPNKRIDYQKK